MDDNGSREDGGPEVRRSSAAADEEPRKPIDPCSSGGGNFMCRIYPNSDGRLERDLEANEEPKKQRMILEKVALEIEEQLRQWNHIGPGLHSFARRRDKLGDKSQREEGGTTLSAKRDILKEVSEVFLNNAGSLLCVTEVQQKLPPDPTQQEVEDALTELDALGFFKHVEEAKSHRQQS